MSVSEVFRPLVTRDLLFLDLETSHLDPDLGDIIEIAAVRTTPDLRAEVAVIDRKLQLERPLEASPEALAINGYSVEEWRHAIPRRIAFLELLKIATDDVLIVGQNPIFDLSHLRAKFKMESLVPITPRYVIDTAAMAWPLVVKGHLHRMNLETLCSRYGIPNDGAHRAMADVRRLMHVYARMLGIDARTAPKIAPTTPPIEEEEEWAKL